MRFENVTPEQVQGCIPRVDKLTEVDRGGQKVVYRAIVSGEMCALKVLGLPPADDGGVSLTDDVVAEVIARAEREVEILRACQSPHVVKPGPLSLSVATIEGRNVVYYTEEWIDGANVRTLIAQQGPFSLESLSRLGVDAMRAIDELRTLGKVHRDIKPANIMMRETTSEYVVLDMGLALDLDGDSLTRFVGAIPGTPMYFSPERIDLGRKRELDFRSDMFSLGIVLYEAGTGVHPFWRPGKSSDAAVRSIVRDTPAPPSALVPSLGPEFDEVCLRMMQKRAHLRFRRCDLAIEALAGLTGGGES